MNLLVKMFGGLVLIALVAAVVPIAFVVLLVVSAGGIFWAVRKRLAAKRTPNPFTASSATNLANTSRSHSPLRLTLSLTSAACISAAVAYWGHAWVGSRTSAISDDSQEVTVDSDGVYDPIADLNRLWQRFRRDGGAVYVATLGAKPAMPDGSKRQRSLMVRRTPTYFARAVLALYGAGDVPEVTHLLRPTAIQTRLKFADPAMAVSLLAFPGQRFDGSGSLIDNPENKLLTGPWGGVQPWEHPPKWYDPYYIDDPKPGYSVVPRVIYLIEQDRWALISDGLALALEAANLRLVDDFNSALGALAKVYIPRDLEHLAQQEGFEVGLINERAGAEWRLAIVLRKS